MQPVGAWWEAALEPHSGLLWSAGRVSVDMVMLKTYLVFLPGSRQLLKSLLFPAIFLHANEIIGSWQLLGSFRMRTLAKT